MNWPMSCNFVLPKGHTARVCIYGTDRDYCATEIDRYIRAVFIAAISS